VFLGKPHVAKELWIDLHNSFAEQL